MVRGKRNIRRFGYAVAFCLAVTAFGTGASSAFESSSLGEVVSSRIRARIADKENHRRFECRGEPICSIRFMPLFYNERSFVPVWLDTNGVRPIAHALIRTIETSDREGLRPGEYHLESIRSMFQVIESGALVTDDDRAGFLADLDILLTDAFLMLSSHLSGGRVNPETLHSDWVLSEKTIDLMKVLHTVVSEAQIDQMIEQLSHVHPGYAGLRKALARMRALAATGGWPQVPGGPILRPGDSDMRVTLLRERLIIGGDMDGAHITDPPEIYDANVASAVAFFQKRHGLEPDGILGTRTLAELNVPADERVRQIELNLERWRWLPHDFGRRYIEVNTADFSLSVIEDQRVALRMRVIVGRPARRTPVFSASMDHMVINPTWTVPHTIAVEDILPKLVEDVSYLENNAMSVYQGWDDNLSPLDPRAIDWRDYGKRYFPFRLVQDPGPSNALGRFKFMFPNRFSVYLHDTPNRNLFGKVQRDYSSGCIRVEDAHALASYLVEEDPEWNGNRLHAVLKSGRQQVVRIKQKIPVHLLYMTAWVDEDGDLHFRRDIYKRDRALDVALKNMPTTLSPALEAAISRPTRLNSAYQVRTGPTSRWTKSDLE
jgi:L,D-transpeptidase YcbB